jgi:hypothetical protein
MELEVPFRNRRRPPAFFCQPDPMLSGNRSSPTDDLAKELIQSGVHSLPRLSIIRIRHHDIYVDVPVAGMPETGDWKTETLLELIGKAD